MGDTGTIGTRMTSALVVDDHPLFLDALTMTLRSVAGIESVRTAGSLSDTLDEIERGGPPDVIVLDLNLPDVSGLDGLVRLRRAAPGVPVVVVSSMADNRVISAALRGGAAAFVPKHSRREIFARAFDAVARREVFTPDGFVAVTEPEAPVTDEEDALRRLGLLTKQQARILSLICEGKLNKQIAYDLSIAETTVKAHVTAIMRKLGVQSRTQAVLIAQQTSFLNLLQSERFGP